MVKDKNLRIVQVSKIITKKKLDENLTKSFKWSKDNKLKIAEYIRDNYQQYKVQAKMNFARKMRDSLLFSCNDLQIKNVMQTMVQTYTQIKGKLNSSGFGIDLVTDQSLDMGWVVKKCPYYHILDEVMSTRPNITPPFIIESSAVGEKVSIEQDDCEENNFVYENEDEDVNCLETTYSDNEDMHDNETINATETSKTVANKEVEKNIQKLFSGIGVSKTSKRTEGGNTSKNALTAFSQILADKMVVTNDVELKNHELDTKRFEYTQLQSEKQLEMEQSKLNMEKELTVYKINAERDTKLLEIQDKKEERQFELKKLELLIQLEKEKQKS